MFEAANVTHAPILDLYAPLNHKSLLAGETGLGATMGTATWVGPEHRRRLNAYRLLEAYASNNARYFLSADPETKAARREYGDAAALVDAIHAALLGESQSVSVHGADAFEAELPDDATPDEIAANAEAELALRRQELLNQWANDERLLIKVSGAEHKTIRLGDGVYELSWSTAKGRPRLRTYDPGFYFPVVSDNDQDYPARVHLAWEIDDPNRMGKLLIRRITYEMGAIQSPTDERGFALVTDEGPVEPINARLMDDGTYERDLPWNEEPTNMTCYISDAVWEVDTGRAGIDDFTGAKAIWTLNEDGIPLRHLDLGIDFIPIIHVPNTPEDEEHFGSSALLKVAQLLDQIHASESDLGDTAATSGTPGIALEGGNGIDQSSNVAWGPGAVINNPNGSIKLLSTDSALDPLSNYSDRLLDRLFVNARVPASAVGRVDPDKVESGIHLALSWGPLRAMTSQMRLVRGEKFPLLFKFVQRMFIANGMIEPDEGVIHTDLMFGNFLPTDLGAVIEQATTLLNAGAISLRTALNMLLKAGLPIKDASDEIKRIKEERLRSAALADPSGYLEALGDPATLGDIIGADVAPLAPTLPVIE